VILRSRPAEFDDPAMQAVRSLREEAHRVIPSEATRHDHDRPQRAGASWAEPVSP
jgi:hypothetical protein